MKLVNNGIDDDNDGFIDLYDDDCSCNELAFQAQCKLECELIPDSFPPIKMKMKWQSDVLTSSSDFPLVIRRNEETRVVVHARKLVGEIIPGIPDYQYKVSELSADSGQSLDSFPVIYKNHSRYTSMCKIR